MTPVTSAKKLTGAWKKLYAWLILDTKCECCDQAMLNKEALAIINAAMSAKARLTGKGLGCIASTNTGMIAIDAGLRALYGPASGRVTSTTVPVKGITRPLIDSIAQWLTGRTAMRTAITIKSPCYVIQSVARWYPAPNWYSYIFWYRHQAILVYPKCRSDKASLSWPFATVIDLYDGLPVWKSWSRWLGGMGNLAKYAGRVASGW